jgi:hypothetical protein
VSSYLVKEDGGRIVLEDGSGDLILETSVAPPAGDYLVQEADGASRFTLEDGTGFVLLESGSTPTVEVVTGGSRFIIPRRHLRTLPLDDDEAASIALLLAATRRRYRPK